MLRKSAIAIAFLLILVFLGSAESGKDHPDYVPDRVAAERIAEAVLVAQYGEDRVKAQLPLVASDREGKAWLVEGTGSQSGVKGGNFGVWIDRHDGCLKLMEHMK